MKPSKIDKQLATYTAAAGAVLAGAGAANADIVYSGVLDLELKETSIFLDFNNDSSPDMGLFHHYTGSPYTSYVEMGTVYMLNGFIVADGPKATDFSYLVDRLSAGAAISGGASYKNFYGRLFWHNTNSSVWSNTFRGNFDAANTGYIGFEFDNAGTTCYGWVHVSEVANDLKSYTIDGWAYDDGGAPITSGSTSAVPEPGSLTLLALGAAGLHAMRRAKRANA